MNHPANPGVMIVIEIKPHHWGWKVFEARGVEPVFPEKNNAIDHAQCRACFRSGEIRILVYTECLTSMPILSHLLLSTFHR